MADRRTNPGTELEHTEELPVVARLVVEVRSDGTRTVARGAIEDLVTGERTAVEARGGTPAALAASLAGRLLTLPLLARRAFRALLPGRRGRERDPEP
jgi:hypothetical protein